MALPLNSLLQINCRARPEELTVALVALDNWTLQIHSVEAGLIQHSSTSNSHAPLQFCGSIVASEYDNFTAFLRKLEAIVVAKRRKGEKGLQKNPAFISSLAVFALEHMDLGTASDHDLAELAIPPAKGGLTDVGQHTGSAARDTCWPLVREVFQELLIHGTHAIDPRVLFQLSMAHFELWLLSRQVQATASSHAAAAPEVLSASMRMLRSAATKAAQLSEDGHDMSTFEDSCAWAERTLHAAAAKRVLAVADSFNMGASSGVVAISEFRLPGGRLPVAATLSGQHDQAAARQRAADNLGFVQLLPIGTQASFSQMLQALRSCKADDSVSSQVVLRGVESQLFSRALAGFGQHLDSPELTDLEAVVDEYRICVQQWGASAPGQTCMQVDLRSSEVLVTWIAHCVFDAAARRAHRQGCMLGYGVGVDWHDLRHLVLSKKDAVDAAMHVAAYLRANTVQRRSLFSLSFGSAPTFDMALRFAWSSRHLLGIWAEEKQSAAARKQGHWDEVQRKKRRAADLRREIASKQNQADALQRRYDGMSYSYSELSSVSTELNSVRYQISSLTGELHTTEKAPSSVIQPLPAREDLALRWLFFLPMPQVFKHLSRSSFLAQQMMLPPTESHLEEWQKLSVEFATQLDAHYHQHQPRKYSTSIKQHSSTTCAVKLVSTVKAPEPATVGGSHIDSLLCPDDGVWHPDDLRMDMGWLGSHGVADALDGVKTASFFNPFASLPAATTELLFTEQVAPPGLPASPLQWMMHVRSSVSSTPADRGNMAIARQDLRPVWLSKPGFLALGSLRAYPVGQLRRLTEVLQLRELPWAQPEVITVIRQMLYQLGTLVEHGGAVQQQWRSDWTDGGGTLAALSSEGEQLADELAQTPRSHDRSIPVAVARPSQLQARQCKLRMLSLLCYGPGALTDAADAAAVLQLMVQVKHDHVFFVDVPEAEDAQLTALHVRCHNVTVRHAAALVKIINSGQGLNLLRDAAACVLGEERTPAELRWGQLGWDRAGGRDESGSFEAVGGGHLYSINIINGEVLLDGFPPGRLPKGILTHPLYKRTFGDHDFEVTRTSDGVLRTTKAFAGSLYDFLCEGSRLSITEIDIQQGVELELLDVGTDGSCGEWGKQLPKRLRELHSHWLARKQKVIVLRPPNFRMHDSHFIASILSLGVNIADYCVSYECWRVPPHARGVPWLKLSRDLWRFSRTVLTELLLLADSSVTAKRILSKFEQPEFIHVYSLQAVSGRMGWSTSFTGGTLLWELPRYRLEFSQHSGGPLVSVGGYGSYKLKACQQLAGTGPAWARQLAASPPDATACSNPVWYTLPEFSMYLVLERSVDERCHNTAGAHLPDVLVLVPRGPLAALYAATSSLVREPLSMATGAQTALLLLRMCWSNEPLAPEEEEQLKSVARLGGHHCAALRVMAHELLLSANQLSFLHAPLADDKEQKKIQQMRLDADAGLDYAQERTQAVYKGWVSNPRSQLTEDEEIRALGGLRVLPHLPAVAFRASRCQTVDVGTCPVDALRVAEIEAKISACVSEAAPPEYVGQERSCVEAYLLHSLSHIPAGAHHSRSFRLLRSAGAVAHPTLPDLLCCAAQPDVYAHLRTSNPYMSDVSCCRLWQGVLLWLQLCVLEDRLERLGAFANAPPELEPTLVRELQLTRTWYVAAHPEWLAFEAEGQLQIRPLNMGEGKSRVILSMLVLALANGQRRTGGGQWAANLVRLNFPSTLLRDAHKYMHRCLTASVLGRKVLLMPFDRDVQITASRARTMLAALHHCQSVGDVVLVAPEHRASLHLKWH
ncbi:hypothetical protein FOA52_003767 [Chlamydomonas sp. UWO 241]|nr:hypothetical protein FOA52_003767 [Chlamydomonas sp. UWO 241]